MAKLPWYMKVKESKIHFHWFWILMQTIKFKLINKKYDTKRKSK